MQFLIWYTELATVVRKIWYLKRLLCYQNSPKRGGTLAPVEVQIRHNLAGRNCWVLRRLHPMLSSSLSQLLERARTRFGLEVEVLDATLQHVYPSSTTALGRMIEESPVVRQSLLAALADS